jgi:hypothetical protein
MANNRFNKQATPKGYKAGGRIKKMGGGMMMQRPMYDKGSKVKKMMGGGMAKKYSAGGGADSGKAGSLRALKEVLKYKSEGQGRTNIPDKTDIKKLKASVTKFKDQNRVKKMFGGPLKAVPADKKGLKKLPTEVRNKMGFMKKGGPVAPAPKKDYKLGTKFQGDYKGKSLPGKVKEFVKTGVKQTVGTAKKIARKFKGE